MKPTDGENFANLSASCHPVLLRPDGKIIYRHTGEIDPLVLKRQIVQAMGRTK